MDPNMSGKPLAKPAYQELYKARVKESLQWVASPLHDLKGKAFKSFHVRHEASMLELFFDLFFVANLATFTAYHDVTTTSNVAAYIGFFLVLWSTWFQITIFDVRFAGDSVFERICKLCQFITFAIFAAVGTNFNPGTYESMGYYRIYQTLAIILAFSRLLLAIQYTVVAFFICSKYKNLILPMTLIIATFLVSAGCLAATFIGFKKTAISNAHIGWWIILPAESFIIVTISSIWRMLSFKETHMNERLSLLTMIIIGEGVIGVSKTVGYLWPTEAAPAAGAIVAMFSIVVMLLLIWQMYFDNHPHGDYGTIKQQWWALSHFFLHLGIVGTVEGSNRMAVIYQAITSWVKISNQITALCAPPIAARNAFVAQLNSTLYYSKADYYDPRSYDWAYYYLNRTLFPRLEPNYCDLTLESDSAALNVEYYLYTANWKRYGIDAAPRAEGYYKTYRTVYTYLWLSVAMMMTLLLFFLWIVRRNKHDRFEWIRLIFRFIIALLAVGVALLNFVEIPFSNFISSPLVVTSICILIGLILFVDRICRWLGTRSFQKKFAIPLPDPDHGHGHGHDEHAPVNHHNSMAFGMGGHHDSMTKTLLSGQTYEMVPSASPAMSPAMGPPSSVSSPAPQYSPHGFYDIQPKPLGTYPTHQPM